jgi:hypothetical protein
MPSNCNLIVSCANAILIILTFIFYYSIFALLSLAMPCSTLPNLAVLRFIYLNLMYLHLSILPCLTLPYRTGPYLAEHNPA